MGEIIVRYSEDFRQNKVASQVYSALREGNVELTVVMHIYNVNTGESTASFRFTQDRGSLDKSKIEKLLANIPLQKVEIN